MKKKICILTIIMFILSTFFSMKRFDERNHWKIMNYDYTDSIESGYFMLSNSDDKNEKLLIYLKECLDRYHINAYQFSFDDVSQQNIIFAYSDDEDYCQRILLEEGQIDALKEFEEYSSNHESLDHRLLSFFHLTEFQLTPFTLSHPKFHLMSGYTFTYKNKEDVDHLIADLKDFDSTIQITFEPKSKHQEVEKNYEHLIYFVLCISIIIFSLLTVMLKETKKIGIMKQEGISSFQIYIHLFLKDLYLFMPIYILAHFIFIFATGYKFVKLVDFGWIMLFHSLIAYGMTILISIILYILILQIPPNQMMKGKSYLKNIYHSLLVLKCVVLLLGISMIATGLSSCSQLITAQLQHKAQIEKYHNLYRVLGIYTYGDAHNTDKQKEFNEISKILVEQNHGFYFEETYLTDQNGNLVSHYFVDDNYLSKYHEFDNLKRETLTVILPNNDAQKLQELFELNYGYLFKEDEIEYIRMDINEAENFSLSYLETNQLNPFSIIEVSQFDGIGINYYYFDGKAENAQKAFDQLLIDHGIKPSFSIKSCLKVYEKNRKQEIKTQIPILIKTALFILLIIVINLQMIEMMIEKNRKRYVLERIEGIRFGSIFFNLILDQTWIYFIVFCLHYLFDQTRFVQLLPNYLLILFFDFIFNMICFCSKEIQEE